MGHWQSIVRFFRSIMSVFGIGRSGIDSSGDRWMSPEWDEQKRELIGKAWGETVDTYLWYDIGHIHEITTDEVDAITKEFFVKQQVGFGDIELHVSSVLSSHTVMRLRGQVRLLPAFTLRGRRCPLYQVGHSDYDRDMINFYAHCNPQAPRRSSLRAYIARV